MAFKEGDKKPEGSGRQKGTLNKRTEKAIDMVETSALDPFEFDLAMLNWDLKKLGISEEMEKEIDTRTQLEMRQAASDSIKPYCYPKLKSAEISIEEDTTGEKVIQLRYAPKGKNGSA